MNKVSIRKQNKEENNGRKEEIKRTVLYDKCSNQRG